MPSVVVYDANVLFPAQLRDLLIRLAVSGLIRAHWSDLIHEEWIAAVLAKRPDLRREQLERTRVLMERALPAARVEGYEPHISSIALPDDDDRHVVAVAIEVGAACIVTFNLRDFPRDTLAPYKLTAVHPDAFVLSLYKAEPLRVLQVMRTHRMALRRPAKSSGEYLATLAKSGLTETVETLRNDDVKL